MRTAAQFKKAFEAYMAKPATERKPEVEAALRQSSETAAVARAEAVAKRDKMKLELKTLVAKKPLSVDGAAGAKELDAELIVALKTGDYVGAMALMDEIKALVTDDTGETTDALKTLRDTRTAEVDKVFTVLGLRTSTAVDGEKPPVEKTTAEARKAKSDDKYPELKNLMAKRGEAVAWQQDEIATVDKAIEELDRLGKVWKTLLDGIMEKRGEVTAALEAQAKTDKDIASSEASEKEEKETKKEAEDMLLTTPLEKQARLQNSIKACDETIAKEQAAQIELKKLQAVHPQTVAAAQSLLDGAVNTAQASLTGEAAKIADAAKVAAKAAPKQGMRAKNASDLLVKLGLSLVPELDIVALKDVSAEPDAKTLEISKVFPEMHLVAEKHGTGRHGVQTGLDRQAGRVNSGLSPDQTGDEGGLGEDLFEKGENPKTGKDGFVDKPRIPPGSFGLRAHRPPRRFCRRNWRSRPWIPPLRSLRRSASGPRSRTGPTGRRSPTSWCNWARPPACRAGVWRSRGSTGMARPNLPR